MLQIEADNPGTWAVHYHVDHLRSKGLFFDILGRPANVRKLKIPKGAG